MMTSLLCAILIGSSMSQPEPAQFTIQVNSRQEVLVQINGNRIIPGKIYRTEPLLHDEEVKISISYIHGDVTKTAHHKMILSRGESCTITFTIHAHPTEAMCKN